MATEKNSCTFSILLFLFLMNSDEIISVVADIGNLYTRAGFTGDDFPRWSTFTKCTETMQFGDEALGYGNG